MKLKFHLFSISVQYSSSIFKYFYDDHVNQIENTNNPNILY